MEVEINWPAVLVAGIALVAIGFIWYLPAVFGKTWMTEVGLTEEKAAEGRTPGVIIWTILAALATALVLAIVIGWSGATNALEGLLVGLLVGIGFFLTNKSVADMYEQRSTRLSLITSGGDIVSMAVAGLILGAWL
ncbi:MAG: DUF1761 domain-containing protein [Acidimicrobiia bacterium]